MFNGLRVCSQKKKLQQNVLKYNNAQIDMLFGFTAKFNVTQTVLNCLGSFEEDTPIPDPKKQPVSTST